MADPKYDALLKKKDEMLKLAEQVAAEQDVEKQKVLVDQMAAMGRELEEMGAELSRAAKETKRAQVEVVLTPDQRKRNEKKHGVDLESIFLPDDAGPRNMAMPSQSPDMIEMYAMQEAERKLHAPEAERLVKEEYERSMAALESIDNIEMQEQLQRLKNDPKFAGNLLKKK
jgi:hypothetical protein